jgi:DNA-directed RNA polymerase specialized sigma24 family protein
LRAATKPHWRPFINDFAPLLYGIAFKIMKDEKDAEDVLQEVIT